MAESLLLAHSEIEASDREKRTCVRRCSTAHETTVDAWQYGVPVAYFVGAAAARKVGWKKDDIHNIGSKEGAARKVTSIYQEECQPYITILAGTATYYGR